MVRAERNSRAVDQFENSVTYSPSGHRWPTALWRAASFVRTPVRLSRRGEGASAAARWGAGSTGAARRGDVPSEPGRAAVVAADGEAGSPGRGDGTGGGASLRSPASDRVRAASAAVSVVPA